MKSIIPCAGFGTRMKMKPNQSKEMLPDPMNDQPLIKWAIWHSEYCGFEPLILVRKEKQDLIDYLDENKVEYIVMKPGKEWAETVYNSKDHWDDQNLLFLPDVRFKNPIQVVQNIKKLLEFGSEVVFGIHEVANPQNWGCLNILGFEEKPEESKYKHAWGLIGFTKQCGEIFQDMQNKSVPFNHFPNTNFTFLEEFQDLTRG